MGQSFTSRCSKAYPGLARTDSILRVVENIFGMLIHNEPPNWAQVLQIREDLEWIYAEFWANPFSSCEFQGGIYSFVSKTMRNLAAPAELHFEFLGPLKLKWQSETIRILTHGTHKNVCLKRMQMETDQFCTALVSSHNLGF